MSIKTVDRIISRAPASTTIGAYTYRVDADGYIIRCASEDIGRRWIDSNGNISDAWVRVAKI